jgi:predicted transcriptional regulator
MVQRIESEIETLNQHIQVLQTVSDMGPTGIRGISKETGLKSHHVRFSVRILEQNELIEPSPRGLQATSQTEEFLSNFTDEIERIEARFEGFLESAETEVR